MEVRWAGLKTAGHLLLAAAITGGIILNVFGKPAPKFKEPDNFDVITTRSADGMAYPAALGPGPHHGTSYRIDRPNVKQAVTDYPKIVFHPGDRVVVYAAGCVQTGGSGKTWKSYVNPQGDNSDRLYHGLLCIPGVTGGGLQRIGGLMNRVFTVPNLPPLPGGGVRTTHLQLGYEDDGYGDNGYYSHDDGNDDQCKGIGPAYVVVNVYPDPATPPVGPIVTPKALFDLVWYEVDENLLPLNPKWAWQDTHPGAAQDLNKVVPAVGVDGSGRPVPIPGTLGERILAKTSQSPGSDSSGFWHSLLSCHSTPGHINWAVATFTGSVTWDNHSTWSILDPGSGSPDDDYNIKFIPPNHESETSDNPNDIGLEFQAAETIDHFDGVPWWARFHDNGNNHSDAAHQMIDGHRAIVTGLLGLDMVHGAPTELHPVYALAIQDSSAAADEKWEMFARNWGNEGFCSQDDHLANFTTYWFTLPWRAGATDAQVSTNFVSTPGVGAPHIEKVPGQAIYIRCDLTSPESHPLQAGEVDIHWTGAPRPMEAQRSGGEAGRERTEALQERAEGGEVDMKAMLARMMPSEQTRFLTIVAKGVMPPHSPRTDMVASHVALTASQIAIHSLADRPQRVKGAPPMHLLTPRMRVRPILDEAKYKRYLATREALHKEFGEHIPGMTH